MTTMIERVARALAEDFIDNELDNVEINPEVYADMNWENFSHKAKVAIAAIIAAGYRILAPGELDAETVERCIKELNKLPWFEDVVSLVDVEDALRALEAQESGE